MAWHTKNYIRVLSNLISIYSQQYKKDFYFVKKSELPKIIEFLGGITTNRLLKGVHVKYLLLVFDCYGG